MNKKNTILSVLLFSLLFISCKTDVKNTINSNKDKVYSIEPLTTKIGWTAYKTTDKVAVKGEFTKINVTPKQASSAKEVLNGLEFSIPVSSVFSNNKERDGKLKQFFFGIMDNTELLSGTLTTTSNNKGTASLTMNGITHSFPVEYMISGQMITLSGTLNLDDWKATKAIQSLNKACFDLHKGADGISKTWSEVKINIATYLKVKTVAV
ncbi:MAG: YceI family protein [Flavobacteriaceae bacterium]|nr:YceI family protein [Flavobacteriaceae bacterium]